MRSDPPELLVGLMSGTSLDGVDAALIRTDGEDAIEPLHALTIPYDPELRKRLRACLGHRRAPGDVVADLTARHADAVRALIAATGVAASDVRAVGFHGQTILHRPADRITVQIGDGQWLADELAIEVVDQFRAADVAAGGEGAPFAPVYHRALLRGGALPAVMVNIGGVSNVTWTDGERLIAFDTGPGNARIDDWMMQRLGRAFDAGGRLGLEGRVDEAKVAAVLKAPFFQRPPPKSLDRDDIVVDGLDGASLADGAATLAALLGLRNPQALQALTAPLQVFRRGETLAIMPNVFVR